MTWEELAISIAAEFGITISKKQAADVLWSETAFPFNTIDGTRDQLRKFFATVKP